MCYENESEKWTGPKCCCAGPFEQDGVMYERISATCVYHGVKSNYLALYGDGEQKDERSIGGRNYEPRLRTGRIQ